MSSLPFYLRCDVSPEIGMGHFRRLQTLSRKLDKPIFVIPEAGYSIALEMGVAPERIISLTDANKGNWVDDAPAGSWIITDICYEGNRPAAETEILALSGSALQVCVIDSMPPDHFDPPRADGMTIPDLVITPYLNSGTLRPAPPAHEWLSGGLYAVLDPIYETQSAKMSNDILVACGGSDPTGLSLRCAKALSEAHSRSVCIVAGPMFDPELTQKLQDWAANHPNRSVEVAPKNLASLIAAHGVVVGRPGLIRYEAAALGRTSILLSETDSYVEYFKAFDESGLAEIYFAKDPSDLSQFYGRVKELAQLPADDPIFWLNKEAIQQVPLNGADSILQALKPAKDSNP